MQTNNTLPIGVTSWIYQPAHNISTHAPHTHTDLIIIVPNIQLLMCPQIVILLPILRILHLPNYTCGVSNKGATLDHHVVHRRPDLIQCGICITMWLAILSHAHIRKDMYNNVNDRVATMSMIVLRQCQWSCTTMSMIMLRQCQWSCTDNVNDHVATMSMIM